MWHVKVADNATESRDLQSTWIIVAAPVGICVACPPYSPHKWRPYTNHTGYKLDCIPWNRACVCSAKMSCMKFQPNLCCNTTQNTSCKKGRRNIRQHTCSADDSKKKINVRACRRVCVSYVLQNSEQQFMIVCIVYKGPPQQCHSSNRQAFNFQPWYAKRYRNAHGEWFC